AETVAPRPAATRESATSAESTRPLADETVVVGRGEDSGGSRRWIIVAGAGALVAAVVLVVILVGSGGGGDSNTTAETGPRSLAASQKKDKPAKPKPKPLSKSEL